MRSITVGIPHKMITMECMGDASLFSYMVRLSLLEYGIPVKINPLNITDHPEIFITGKVPVHTGHCEITMGVENISELMFICRWNA